MARSPGHQKWPEHKVQEKALNRRVQILAGGEVIADSAEVMEVDEDKHPARYYIPRSGVDMKSLQETGKTTECPFKGTARYFSLNTGDRTIEDAAWSYEEPYDEHRALKELIAFHDENPEIEIRWSD